MELTPYYWVGHPFSRTGLSDKNFRRYLPEKKVAIPYKKLDAYIYLMV